jgi:hypothetical protein
MRDLCVGSLVPSQVLNWGPSLPIARVGPTPGSRTLNEPRCMQCSRYILMAVHQQIINEQDVS